MWYGMQDHMPTLTVYHLRVSVALQASFTIVNPTWCKGTSKVGHIMGLPIFKSTNCFPLHM